MDPPRPPFAHVPELDAHGDTEGDDAGDRAPHPRSVEVDTDTGLAVRGRVLGVDGTSVVHRGELSGANGVV